MLNVNKFVYSNDFLDEFQSEMIPISVKHYVFRDINDEFNVLKQM